jgi:hypothetical protein
MQNGIERLYPQNNHLHILSRCALPSQASSRRFLFIAEHYKCGRANFRYGIADMGSSADLVKDELKIHSEQPGQISHLNVHFF